MNPSIIVVGSINIDLVARCARLPGTGETVPGLGFATYHGGKGANQAVAAARLGHVVALVGAVGSDSFAPSLITALQQAGVGTDHIQRAAGPSGTAVILSGESGENSIVVVPGANQTVSAASVTQAFLAVGKTRVVLAQLELPLPAVECAALCAHRTEADFVLDPAPMRPLSRSLLEAVDWLTPNSSEASSLLGMDVTAPTAGEALTLASKLLKLGPRNVLLKLGEYGVAAVTAKGQALYQPAFRVPVVDTTAAGDAFNGGFAAALCQNLPLAEALRYASAVAALSVTVAGAQPSMPFAPAVGALMKDHQEGPLSP